MDELVVDDITVRVIGSLIEVVIDSDPYHEQPQMTLISTDEALTIRDWLDRALSGRQVTNG